MSHPPRTVGAWPVNVPSTRAPTAARTPSSGPGAARVAARGTRWSKRPKGQGPLGAAAAVAPPLPITQVDPRQWQAEVDGDRRARSGARRRARRGVGHARRGRAGHRQVDAVAAGRGLAREKRRALPLHLRRGVRRAGAGPRRTRRCAGRRACGSRASATSSGIVALIEQHEPQLVVVDSIQTDARPRARHDARHRHPGPRLRAAARRGHEANRHLHGARRPCHQGGRARRPPGARARRRHGALVQRRSASRAPAAARCEASVRFHRRARAVRDGRARPRSACPIRARSSSPIGAAAFPARSSCRRSTATVRCSSRCRRWSRRRGHKGPRRSAQGIDPGRLALLIAVLEQRVGVCRSPASTSTSRSPVASASPSRAPTSRIALAIASARDRARAAARSRRSR